jgi:DNA repair protein RecN (Recombination protein N)
VVVVTHLPQVAAFADRHLVVDKSSGGGITRSGVRTLAEADRVVELARMLAGLDSTDTGRAHAEELLAAANADKTADRVAAEKPTSGGRKKAKARN